MTGTHGASSGIALSSLETPSVPPTVSAGVSCVFTTRRAGVSEAPYDSANIGGHVGDNAEDVERNRRLALASVGADHLLDALLVPHQVHGDTIVSLTDNARIDEVRDVISRGCDGIICHAPDVPVLLCFADCVPLILIAPGGSFAVLHSGWKGTIARIASTGVTRLSQESGCDPSELQVYIGPHIRSVSYEVSPDLAAAFTAEFSEGVIVGERNLDLEAAIITDLEEAGVPSRSISSVGLCTHERGDLFFSHRRDRVTGRHGALAVRLSER